MPQAYAPSAISGGFKYLVDQHADMDRDGDYDNADRLVLGGVMGDAAHSFGYHLAVVDCPAGDYSITESFDRGKNVDKFAASALDVTPKSRDVMPVITKRLRDASQAGDPRMVAVVEFCGTLDGNNTYPWSVVHNTLMGLNSWDDSHLWHVHISFKRSYANNAKAIRDVMDVIAGIPITKEFTVDAAAKTRFDKIDKAIDTDRNEQATFRAQTVRQLGQLGENQYEQDAKLDAIIKHLGIKVGK